MGGNDLLNLTNPGREWENDFLGWWHVVGGCRWLLVVLGNRPILLPPHWFSGIDERRQAISRLPPRRSFGKSWESEEQKGQQSPRFYLRSWKATDGPEIIPGFSEIDSIVSSWCPIVVQDFVNNIESPHHQTYQYVDRRKGFLAARLIPGKGGRGHQAGREGSLLSTKWIIHLGTTNTFPPSNSQAETSAQVVGVSQEAVLNAGDWDGRGCMCKWEGGRVEPKLRMAPIWGKHCREWGQFRIGPILRQTRQRFHRRHFSPICHVINFSCTFMFPFWTNLIWIEVMVTRMISCNLQFLLGCLGLWERLGVIRKH